MIDAMHKIQVQMETRHDFYNQQSVCTVTTFLSVQIKWKLISNQKRPHIIPFRFHYVLEFCHIFTIFVLYILVLIRIQSDFLWPHELLG